MAEKSVIPAVKQQTAPPTRSEPAQLGAPVESLLALQKSAGNRAVRQLLSQSPGQPLDAATRRWMEARFGADFGRVQVHVGYHASLLTRTLQARAVTTGKHIAFGNGEYAPHTASGRRLIAHELAHVLQQSSALPIAQRDLAGATHEHAADRAADHAQHELGKRFSGAAVLANRAGSAPALVQSKPAATPQSPKRPEITPEINAEIDADIDFIVQKLANFETDFKDRQEIVAVVERYDQADRDYYRATGYKGSDFLDRFLLKTKIRSFSRKSFRSMFQSEYLLVFDALWHDLYGIWLEKFKKLVQKSRKQATNGPLSEAPENPWKTLSKQEAMGMWGILKGMGTAAASGLVDAPAKGIVSSMQLAGIDVVDPVSAAAWLEKQYDISGEALFGKEYSQGEALLLGMNAAQIGTAGGKAIWTLVMLGAGKGAPTWVKGTLASLGVLGNFDGIISSATNIAKIVYSLQAKNQLGASSLLTNTQFLEEVTKLAANIFGAVSAGLGTNKTVSDTTRATFARLGILFDLSQVSVMVGKLIEITTSDMSAQSKEKAAGQVVAELITSAASIAAGTAEYRKEYGKTETSAAEMKTLEAGENLVQEVSPARGQAELTPEAKQNIETRGIELPEAATTPPEITSAATPAEMTPEARKNLETRGIDLPESQTAASGQSLELESHRYEPARDLRAGGLLDLEPTDISTGDIGAVKIPRKPSGFSSHRSEVKRRVAAGGSEQTMEFGEIPESQISMENQSGSGAPSKAVFERQNELTPAEMEARIQRNAPESERSVGSPGTATHGESESRAGENYRLFNAAEVAIGLRTDFSPEHNGYIRSVEFDAPEVVGNFGTRGGHFNKDPLLNEINIEHMSHETLTHTPFERGHAVAQQFSGGDPDVAAVLMTTSNVWPMRGRGSKGVNQGAYEAFEDNVIALKAGAPNAAIRVRVEAVVGSTPEFVTKANGQRALVPEAFDITVTVTPPDGAPQVANMRILNQ